VAGGWRRLHNEELHNLYTSPNIIIFTKSRRLIWVRHVARIGETRNAYKILVGNLNERDHSEDVEVAGRIILEWMSWNGKLWDGGI
jgi:hypothetical protein